MTEGFVFEGPEKRLEVIFRVNENNSEGLRQYKSNDWQKQVLNQAKCTILNVTSNEFFDAYVLSESSLFVFPYKIMIKTCGTTTLLRCVPKIIELAAEVGTEAEFIKYSRKNFNFPHQQLFPHTCFEDETKFLADMFQGNDFVFGDKEGEHYNLFIAEKNGRSFHRPERNLEMMMGDLDTEVMKQFFSNGTNTGKEVTKSSGIYDLMPGYTHDEFLFQPCGYSVNGLKGDSYYTIHITPEAGFSYVSFETNEEKPKYSKLIEKAVEIFKPGKFCLSLLLEDDPEADPTLSYWSSLLPGYEVTHEVHQSFDGFKIIICHFKSLYLVTSQDSEMCGA